MSRAVVPFAAVQLDALRELVVLWSDVPFALVGASALGCFFDCRWRRTYDLDVTVSLGLAPSARSFELGLPGWTRNPLLEHEWRSPGGAKVDILPAGPELLATGTLEWPGSGQRMNLAGFRHVFSRRVQVEFASDLRVPVAPPAVLALLKVVAYLDRPFERQRDLQDFAYLLDEYSADDDPRRWSDETFAQKLDYGEVSAFWLGRDLSALLDDDERTLVEHFLAKLSDERDAHGTRQHLLRLGPSHWGREAARLHGLLAALRRGLAAQSAEEDRTQEPAGP